MDSCDSRDGRDSSDSIKYELNSVNVFSHLVSEWF